MYNAILLWFKIDSIYYMYIFVSVGRQTSKLTKYSWNVQNNHYIIEYIKECKKATLLINFELIFILGCNAVKHRARKI